MPEFVGPGCGSRQPVFFQLFAATKERHCVDFILPLPARPEERGDLNADIREAENRRTDRSQERTKYGSFLLGFAPSPEVRCGKAEERQLLLGPPIFPGNAIWAFENYHQISTGS